MYFRLVPQKLYREWKALFEEGHPLYDQAPVTITEVTEPTPEQILEEERQKLLDEGDFNEYRVSKHRGLENSVSENV